MSVRHDEARPGDSVLREGPEPGTTFDMRAVRVRPLPASWLPDWTFPSTLQLGRAHGAQDRDRVAFLVHGFAMNEDYFALLAPELLARGYDVWALRLPGYVGSGTRATRLWPVHVGMSLGFYAWVAASAMAHVAQTLARRPAHFVCWGHSLGATVLHEATASWRGAAWAGADRLVLEAPAYPEAIPFSTAMIAAFSALPDGMLNQLARALLMDDIRANATARRQSLTFVPGRTSRLVLTMNALALANPLSRTSTLPADLLRRCLFVVAEFDRLVDHDRLVAQLDGWYVPRERRLVLPRNHLLSLTCAREMVRWVEER